MPPNARSRASAPGLQGRSRRVRSACGALWECSAPGRNSHRPTDQHEDSRAECVALKPPSHMWDAASERSRRGL